MQSSKVFDTHGVLSTPASDVHERLKTNVTAIKTARETTDNPKKKYNLVKHIQRPQFSFTKTSIKVSLQAEIGNLKTRLLEEQEKSIALENHSRHENLRFMNVPEHNDENCVDAVYDIIENDININVEDIHFHAVHRVGKPRSEDASKSFPRPIIARFLGREERHAVFRARNRLKDSSRAKDVYITQDYAKAIQQERKVLIKAMFQAKERGLSAKVIDRKLIINNVIYKVSNIPEDLRPLESSAHA